MVTRVGRYYRALFKGHQWVTHGDHLLTTIFNMVVEAVIQHWITLIAGEEEGLDSFGRAIQCLVAFLYADDSLLEFPRPSMPQVALDVPIGLFDRVDLQKKLDKTVGMV